MKIIHISILRTEVLNELAQTTAYAGSRRPAEVTDTEFAKIATVEEDTSLLTLYWEEACSMAVERLKQFVATVDFAGAALILSLAMSDAYDLSLTPSVECSLKAFLMAAVAARWFRMALPEAAPQYEGDALRLMADVERKLYHRVAPRRKTAT